VVKENQEASKKRERKEKIQEDSRKKKKKKRREGKTGATSTRDPRENTHTATHEQIKHPDKENRDTHIPKSTQTTVENNQR